jgi:uncharacterized membrane protein
MLTIIGSMALTEIGIVGLLGVERARLVQTVLLAVSLVIVAVFVFHLGERHWIAKQKAKDYQLRGT